MGVSSGKWTPRKVRSLVTLLAASALSIGACSCAGSSNSATLPKTSHNTPIETKTASTENYTEADRDKDGDIGAFNDEANNDKVLDYGHAANPSQTRAITALVKRYYTAEAAADGATACTLLYSPIAERVPEMDGQSPPGEPYSHGTSCPVVMTLIFKHFHPRLTAGLHKLTVSRVRVEEGKGLAVLTFGTMPERELSVEREGQAWKITSLLDTELA